MVQCSSPGTIVVCNLLEALHEVAHSTTRRQHLQSCMEDHVDQLVSVGLSGGNVLSQSWAEPEEGDAQLSTSHGTVACHHL